MEDMFKNFYKKLFIGVNKIGLVQVDFYVLVLVLYNVFEWL